ncbi:unnamed protein product [Malassezia sympodialis ATCC 42132]|uniref:Similar to S.cerevisiae protein TRS33 (Core component of transport protein particle (TRAPP) complexes I-III) n=1 Tax=Malassezia sympodialis (strain ATCC 42132) TaxID=1230383 RepID=M5EB23_MALS4|nr:uncharacterized protein MSY001_2265 [Malassezia sympodialis ATCC 42132]CCU99559.1 unnamed protein product [Malassezia sympodialis ATCC 42132]SHO78268.1 Similar to S.cerevisiae protein TRS33 (Core component of transport protein particle (TRAPP) complexes I-III) [Malassezia sympodialis ATCC 42132]|eukprot:XP_018740800.1 uncharacterized protein MSY001_2265 [Malassezia sympodialis ATCC 42132]
MEYAAPSLGASTPSTVPLATTAARSWTEKPPAMVDYACCALLFTEMANALQASTAYKTQRANDIVAELQQQDPGAYVPPLLTTSDQADMANSRMEELGRHVGANLTEKLGQGKPRMNDTLERVKFVCKDLWSAVWDKQIDNLRTNHRGVFVLQDHSLKTLAAVRSADKGNAFVAMVGHMLSLTH